VESVGGNANKPASFVAETRLSPTQCKGFWKAITKGSPDGVRHMLHFFFAYAAITDLFSFVQLLPGTAPNHDGSDWKGFSAVLTAFYYASLAILSSALHSSSEVPTRSLPPSRSDKGPE
jgi:hypothetical protein